MYPYYTGCLRGVATDGKQTLTLTLILTLNISTLNTLNTYGKHRK